MGFESLALSWSNRIAYFRFSKCLEWTLSVFIHIKIYLFYRYLSTPPPIILMDVHPTPSFFTSAWSPLQTRYPAHLLASSFNHVCQKGFGHCRIGQLGRSVSLNIPSQNRLEKKWCIPSTYLQSDTWPRIPIIYAISWFEQNSNKFQWSRSWSKSPCSPWMLCSHCHHWFDGTEHTRCARHFCRALGIREKANKCWARRRWCWCSKTG